jgi:hypothetical protein
MKRIAFAAALFALFSAAASAQQTSGALYGQGSEELSVLANEMRVTVSLDVKADSIEGAFEKLKTEQERLRALVVEAGALEDSVEFTDASTGAAASSRMEQNMRRMMKASNMDEEEAEKKTLSFTLKCTWPLTDESYEKQVIEADHLKDAIVALDFVNKEEMTPEELEEMEELGLGDDHDYDEYEYMMMYEQKGVQAGVPSFAYVREIDGETVRDMVRKATAKAKAAAVDVASVTGVELKELQGVGWNVVPTNEQDTDDYYQQQMYMRMMASVGMASGGASSFDDVTAVGMKPGSLKVIATVTAIYGI